MTQRILAAKVTDLQHGEMKEVDLGDVGKILLIKEHDSFYATGNKCSHFGFSLKGGIFSNGHVRCTLHGACFNVKTGDIEDYPSFAAIHVFQTEVIQDEVWVTYDPEKVKNFRRTVDTKCPQVESTPRVVIIGGGPVAVTCADTLRQKHFKGEIIILSRENYLPCDRIKLSKQLAITPEQAALHTLQHYNESNIQIRTNSEVVDIDTSAKFVSLKDGSTVNYDQLLIATGGDPRKLSVPGVELENIFYLREIQHANAVNNSVTDKSNVVVIGSSFIGMEVAASLLGKVASVTVLGRGLPFERILGPQVGRTMKQLAESKGVKFVEKATKSFRGTDGKVTTVVFDDGTEIPADVVVIGIGVTPATTFVPSTISKHSDGSIVVDEFFRTSAPDVYAAGDVAHFKYLARDEHVRIEHWAVAQKQGAIVASNLLQPNSTSYTSTPFFWCMIFGKAIRFCGYVGKIDELIFHQDNADPYKFVVYYCENGRVVGVAAQTSEPVVSGAAELFSSGRMATVDQVRDPNFQLLSLLKQ